MDIDKITTTKMDLLQKSIEREFGKEISHIVARAMTGVIATIFLNSALHGVSATKTLDVHICHIRRRLEPFRIRIETLWGYGFQMSPAHRAKARELVEKRT